MAQAASKSAPPAPAPAPAPARSAKGSPHPAAAPARRHAGTGAATAKAGAATAVSAASIRDPRFRQAMAKLNHSATKARTHAPAAKKAAEAEAAARPPPNERLAGAKANQVGDMGAAPTGNVQPKSFLETLRAAIKEVMPKKTADADDYMKGDDRGKLTNAVSGNVGQQKDETTAGLKGASKQPPDANKVPEQPSTEIPETPPPGAPPIGAADAMPPPKTAGDVSFDQKRNDSDKLLADNELTGPQLSKANDPRFSSVLTTKGEADRCAEKAPGQYRGKEQGVLATAAKQARQDEGTGLAGMHGQSLGSAKKVKAHQLSAREKDERARKEVADHIEGIYTRTKQAVDDKLAGLDKEVESLFSRGVDRAIERMKDYVETRFDDRYSGITGKALWLKDKLLPLPDKVKVWFDEAHLAFTQDLDNLVVAVAGLVEKRLVEAKTLIDGGQKEIRDYVAGLPASLKATGEAAEKEMNSRFDELRQGVEDKKGDLARSLAQRYKEATEKGDKALQDLKDAHKSLYEKVRDAVLTVVRILREFKDRVLGLLKKAAGVIGIIVGDPIGFLGNILSAIKKGLGQFVDNIWTHLKNGFLSWLFGSLADTGITMPKDLSLPSLLQLALQVLGITYDRIRAKAVALIGERNVGLIEKVASALKVLITEGPAKLWEMMKEWVGDLKATIIDAIQDWLITTIVKAAVTKLVSMFNPVGAIIQAILTIYNVVMFLIENIRKIVDFVEAVINSVVDIANGAIGTAANWIEKALARMVPLLIGFLARLLGISGITDKIVGTIKKLQSKVDVAIDKVIGKIAAGVQKVVGAAKEVGGKVVSMIFPKKTVVIEGEKHVMEVEGEGRGAEVVVHSNRMTIPQVVTRGRNQGDPATVKKADTLEGAHQAWARLPPGDVNVAPVDADYKKKSSALQGVYKLAEEILVEVLPKKDQDTISRVTWDPLDAEGRAQGLTADPLTRKGVKGSSTSSGEPIRGSNTARTYDGEQIFYNKTHLLHGSLGGPGKSFNLTPTTVSVNQQIRNGVEDRALREVIKQGESLVFKVKVDYAKPSPTAAEEAKVRPVKEGGELKFAAKKLTFTVTNKTTKVKWPVFKYENWK